MLCKTVAKCVRVCCRPNHPPKDTQQLDTLLRALLHYTIPLEPAERVQLLKQTISDDSDELMELHHDALDLMWATGSPVIVDYYLQHQPRILELDLIPLINHNGRLTTFRVVADMATLGNQPMTRQCLELMLQRGMRFTSDLASGFYEEVSYRMEEDEEPADVKNLNHLRCHSVPFPMQDGCRRLRAHWDLGNCTLLEKLIMLTGRFTDYWSPANVARNGGDPLEYCARIPQSRRITFTAMRYLIAAGGATPVPEPNVFARLLNNFSLPTLFAVLYVLYRAGRKVVLPDFDAGLNVPAEPRPLFFREVAIIIHELILRCSHDPCPKSFLNELRRVGGLPQDQQETLGILAFRALRRNIRSAFSPCQFPRISNDNYDELAQYPSFGEIHLPPTSSFVPPRFAAMLNLSDLMDQYKASVTEAELVEVMWL